MATPTTGAGFRVSWQVVGGTVGLFTLAAAVVTPIRTQDKLAMSVDNLTRTVERLEATVTAANGEARTIDRVVAQQRVEIDNLKQRVAAIEQRRGGG